MKVRKILPFLLSFCLLFGSGSSLNVRAADGEIKPISTDKFDVYIGYTPSNTSFLTWKKITSKLSDTTWRGTLTAPNNQPLRCLYFQVYYHGDDFSPSNRYSFNVNMGSIYPIKANNITSLSAYCSGKHGTEFFKSYDVAPDSVITYKAYTDSSVSDLNMDFTPVSSASVAFCLEVKLSSYSYDGGGNVDFVFGLKDITDQLILEGLDRVEGSIEQGNQQAHEDASKVEDAIQQGNQQAHEDAKEQKNLLGRIVDGILGLPKLIIDGLIDGLKKLFIPDSEAVSQIIKDIQDTFSDAFGFLSYPFDLLGKVLDLFLKAGGDAVITVPEWRFMDHVVIPEYTYNLSENQIIKQLLPYIRSLTSCILAWNFLGLCRKKYDEVIKGGDSS